MTDNGTYRILVADDEEVIREACHRILTREGHEVLTATEGEEAWRLIQENDFDLAVLDIKMPVMDGIAVMDLISRQKPGLIVVVITGHGANETLAEARRAGAADFLTKPFSPNELRQAVSRALSLIQEPVRQAGAR